MSTHAGQNHDECLIISANGYLPGTLRYYCPFFGMIILSPTILYTGAVACIGCQVAYPWSLAVADQTTAKEEVPSLEGRSLRDLLHLSRGVQGGRDSAHSTLRSRLGIVSLCVCVCVCVVV